MKRILICQHGGSKNHGCEALARTVYTLIRAMDQGARVTLYTYSMPQDEEFLAGLPDLQLRGLNSLPGRYSPHNIGYHLKKRMGIKSASKLPITREFKALVEESDLVIAIGGDNYCYNRGQGYYAIDRYIASRGKKYMLLGCSIEPDDLDKGLGEHLKLFRRITVRESISMEAMEAWGLDNIAYVPDSAFLLEPKNGALPQGFVPARAVGINFSPLVIQNEKNPGMTLKNFVALTRYILAETDMQVALIPHVTWPDSDDRQALASLQQALGPSDRLFTLPELDAGSVKGIIGSLRFFVGARTHATIAAYSSLVPTLTLGYSVKARGIAKDLLGSEEGYVLPVQALEREDQLKNAFQEIQSREEDMRRQLAQVMPGYQEKARKAAGQIKEQLHD